MLNKGCNRPKNDKKSENWRIYWRKWKVIAEKMLNVESRKKECRKSWKRWKIIDEEMIVLKKMKDNRLRDDRLKKEHEFHELHE